MPKLDKKMSKAVANTEPDNGGGFEPIPAGKYAGRLAKVEVRDNPDKHGAVQWSAEFEQIHTIDGEKKPGRQWLNLTLPSSSDAPMSYEKDQETWEKYQNLLRGRLSAFFDSFGFTADSDTDEMIGEWALLNIGIRTIQSGARTGEKVNSVNGIESIDDTDFEVPEDDAADGSNY